MVKITIETENKMHKLRAVGLSYGKIGKQLGVSATAVHRHVVAGAKENNRKATQEYYRTHPRRKSSHRQEHYRIKITPEIEVRMRKLRALGLKYEDIGEYFGTSCAAVSNHLNPEVRAGTKQRYEENHPGWRQSYSYRMRVGAQALLGGKCSGCEEADWRVLQVAHIEGNGKIDLYKYRSSEMFYKAIIDKRRSTEGLILLCANCNIISDLELGRWSVKEYPNNSLRPAVIKLLGGKCTRCSKNDLRVLQVNHINGGGREEYRKRGRQRLYGAILRGTRKTNGLNVLCANCNILTEYESGRIKPGPSKEL